MDHGPCALNSGYVSPCKILKRICVRHQYQTSGYICLQAVQGANGSSTQKGRGGLGPFAIISLSYILFTTTDGGVRIIVLLHAYQQGFTALALAAIFAGYELAGMIVNLLAGLVGARWGIKVTLLAGLTFQLAALAMLFGWQVSRFQQGGFQSVLHHQ